MFVLTLVALCLSSSVHAREECPATTNKCSANDAAVIPVSSRSQLMYYYLGGMFGLHEMGRTAYECGAIRERGIQNLEMFLHTVRHYRTASSLKIGAIAFDSCSRQEQIVEKLMSFEKCSMAYYQDQQRQERIDPRLVLTYVGPDRSGEGVVTADILGDMSKVQISHAASTAQLNDKHKYPYFLRTSQSDDKGVRAILELMRSLSFGFTLVVRSDNVYGKGLYDVFVSEMSKYDVCVVATEVLPINKDDSEAYEALVDRLLKQKVVYSLVVLANDDYAKALLKHIGAKYKSGAFAIFGTDSWAKKEDVIKDSLGAAEGAVTIAMKPNTVDLSDFKSYFKSLKPSTNTQNPWFKEYWQEKFKCDLDSNSRFQKKCDQQLSLRDVDFDVHLPNTKLAVEAAILGIEKAINQSCKKETICSYFINDKPGDKIYKHTSSILIDGKPVFNTSTGGTAQWRYEIFNVVGGKYLEVGTYTSDLGLKLTTTILNHNRKPYTLKPACPTNKLCCGKLSGIIPSTTTQATVSPKVGATRGKLYAVYFDNDTEITGARRIQERPSSEYRTRFDLNQNWIIALGVLAGLGIVVVIVLELYIMYKVIPVRENRQLRSMWLGQLLILGIFLSYLTLFAYIPEPTDATCTITRLGVGLSYAICFSVLLVKLMILNASQSNEQHAQGDGSNYLKGSYQVLMFLFCIGIQIVIDVQWLITIPPEAVKVNTLNNEEAWVCNHYTWLPVHGYQDMKFFIRSEFENHVISLVYVMFLILITSIVALKLHGIVTNHRESVFIGISAGFAIPVWLAWTLIAHFNNGDPFAHQYGDACIAFGLFVTVTIILAAMFLPKVRKLNMMGIEGVYLEDDVDTVYANGSTYGPYGVPPSYRSKAGPGSVVYMSDHGIYSEPVSTLDPRSNHLKYPASNYSVHSLPAYVRRPDSVYNTSGAGTMKMATVTADLTGKHRKAQSEFGTTKSNHSYKSSTMKRARSTQDIGAL